MSRNFGIPYSFFPITLRTRSSSVHLEKCLHCYLLINICIKIMIIIIIISIIIIIIIGIKAIIRIII